MSDVKVGPVPEREPETVIHHAEPVSRLSWGAIFAGAVCGTAIYVVLSIIGLSVGFAVVDPAQDQNPLQGVATGAGLWWLASALVSFFAGGLIAGRLSGVPLSIAGTLHGLTVWALGSLALIALAASTIGSAVTGVAGAMTSLVGQNQRMIQVRVAPQQNMMQSLSPELRANLDRATTQQQTVMDDIRREASSFINQLLSGREQRQISQAVQATYADVVRTPGDAGQDLRQLYETLLGNEGVIGRQQREEAKQLLMQRLGVPEADADRVLERWQQQYSNAVSNMQQAVSGLRQDLSQWLGEQQAQAGEAAGEAQQAFRSVVSERQQREATQIIRATAADIAENPANVVGELQQMLDRLFGAEKGVFTREDANEAAALLERTTGIEEAQAERIVNRWQTRYQAAVQESQQALASAQKAALDAAQTTTDVLAETSAWAALSLVLAGLAAALGGMLGRPDDWLYVREQVRQAPRVSMASLRRRPPPTQPGDDTPAT